MSSSIGGYYPEDQNLLPNNRRSRGEEEEKASQAHLGTKRVKVQPAEEREDLQNRTHEAYLSRARGLFSSVSYDPPQVIRIIRGVERENPLLKNAMEEVLATRDIAVLRKESGKVVALASLTTKIAKGAFKELVKGMSSKSTFVAVAKTSLEDIEREVDFSREFADNPFIMTSRRVTYGNEVRLMMPYAEGGTLATRMENEGFQEIELANYIQQLFDGIALIHAKNWVHRDIKPENILIHAGRIKVSDFGLACRLKDNTFDTQAGTPGYMAPEIIMNGGGDVKVDAFSLGVMVLELLGFTQIPDRKNFNASPDRWHAVIENAIERYESCTPKSALMQILIDMIEPDPADRITVQEALKRIDQLNLLVEIRRLDFVSRD